MIDNKINFLKPTKKKIIISLLPLFALFLALAFLIEIPYFPFSEFLIGIQVAIMLVSYGAILLMAFPFKPILIYLGMWEYHESLFMIFSGSDISVSGMILVSCFYSMTLYLLMSFLSYRKI